MRAVAGTLRLELAQYRELAAFAQFGSDLDKTSQAQLARGKRWVEVLKQGPYSPIPVEKQVAIIFAGGQGFLDDIAVEDVRRFETELYRFLDTNKPDLLNAIREKRELNDDIKNQLKNAINEFKQAFTSGGKAGKPQQQQRQPGRDGREGGQSPNGARPAQAGREAEKLKSNA
jgi:F-type H+/Na+-transporting ATPase subunit alpha